jgi:hypothetical protein
MKLLDTHYEEYALSRWLVPSLPRQAPDVIVPHAQEREVAHG